MAKLLRSRKQFGRCSVAGHGSSHVVGYKHGLVCEVVADIQTTPFTRAQEKREIKEEIESNFAEWAMDRECPNCENGGMLVRDKYGIFCVVNGCGWKIDEPLSQAVNA